MEKIILVNLLQHNNGIDFINRKYINNIMFDDQKLIVSKFKDFLLWDETSDFIKRYITI